MRRLPPIRIVSTLLLLLLLPLAMSAQEGDGGAVRPATGPRLGVFGEWALGSHTASFIGLPGTESCCVGFTGGDAAGIGAGALLELPLGSTFELGARASLLTVPFSMTTRERTYIITEGVGSEGTFEHRLDGSMVTLGLEPRAGVLLFDALHASLGLRAAMVVSSEYDQREILAEPSGSGTFMNPDGTDSHRRIRNQFTGPLPDPALQIAPLVSVGYDLPLNARRTMLLAPEITYQIGLGDLVEGVDWKVNMLRIGLALKFAAPPVPPSERRREEIVDTVRVLADVVTRPYARGVESTTERTEESDVAIVTTETVRRTDTLFAQAPPHMTAAVTAVGVHADGRELPVAKIRIEEFSSTLMTPLLHYVFFDEGSSTLPSRYIALDDAAVGAFSVDATNSPARLPTYYHLLNIIARRLLDNPQATVTLTGCNQDIREEKGNTALSRSRAEAVRDYLLGTWKIAPERIRIAARNLPESAANTQTDDGSQENRRVEITSNDPRILAPVITHDTLRRTDPPVIRFQPSVGGDEPLATWQLGAAQTGASLTSYRGADSLPQSIDWEIARLIEERSIAVAPVDYRLDAAGARGATAAASNAIPVELVTLRQKKVERRDDKEIDRFSLILFEVRSAKLTPAHTPLIALMKEHVRPNSDVSVVGYTDRLGNAQYNQQLAEGRAGAVAKALGVGSARTEGIGQAKIFDNTLPEGRLYTRTVDVVIETPVTHVGE
jgi:outer membrane protein OmpA-like peptidoglycan-associated protein